MGSHFQETQQLKGTAAVALGPGKVLNDRCRLDAERGEREIEDGIALVHCQSVHSRRVLARQRG